MASSSYIRIGEAVVMLILAGVLAWVGLGIPAHFRATSPAVLREAGRGDGKLEALQASWEARGQIGPLGLTYAARDADRTVPTPQAPIHAWTGGPAPFLREILDAPTAAPPPAPPPVLGLLLPADARRDAVGYLDFSEHPAVRSLLSLRRVTGFTQFIPARQPGGQPLEATLLLTALLVQGNYLPTASVLDLKQLADRVIIGDQSAFADLERSLFAWLALGKRLDWSSLRVVADRLDDLATLEGVAYLFQRYPDRTADLFLAVALAPSLDGLLGYFEALGPEAWPAVDEALAHGSEALGVLAREQKPLYAPSPLMTWLSDHTAPLSAKVPGIVTWTRNSPGAALAGKALVLFLAGFALALAGNAVLGIAFRDSFFRRTHRLVLAANAAFALLIALNLAALLEPNLLQFAEAKGGPLRLVFEAVGDPQLSSRQTAQAMLDQVTILTLILFLVLQLVVYIFGLLKLREVRQMTAPPKTKLRVLENEENLFDLGLYVGLGGTVAALILLALQIVEASLIAAYASTLFGIVFTAVLKIIHVRPYRRLLILAHEGAHERTVTTIVEEEEETTPAPKPAEESS